MNTRTISWRRIAAACALVAAAPAWAASSGSLATGPISVQVFDLRPADGIAPAITFDVSGFDAGLAAAAQDTWPLELELRARYGSWQGSSLTASTQHASTAATISGGGAHGPAGTTMSLHGSVVDFGGKADAAAAFVAQAALADQGAAMGFTLAPWTALVISMDVSAQLAATHATDIATASLQLWMADANGGNSQSDDFALDCAGPCSLSGGRTMGLTFLNESDAAFAGSWSVFATLGGTAFASAVPEPGSAAMLLAGVGMLGRLARRRNGDRGGA